MSTPAKHDIEAPPQPIVLWSDAGAGAVAKYLVVGVGAALAMIITAFRTPVLPSNLAQCVVLGLYALAAYFGKPAPVGMPAGAARWFQSAKVRIGIAAAVLSALVPLVTTYLDTGDWRTLTGPQWLVVTLAVVTAFTSWATPNREVTTIDQAGNALSPTAKQLEAIGRHVDMQRPVDVSTLPPAPDQGGTFASPTAAQD